MLKLGQFSVKLSPSDRQPGHWGEKVGSKRLSATRRGPIQYCRHLMNAAPQPYAATVHFSGTFRSFQDRNYRLLWPANILAYTSRWMQMTLLAWLVLVETNSPLRVSLVGVFAWTPLLLLGLVGGLLADTMDRRRLLMGIHAVTLTAALVMTGLLWTGSERFWHAYVVILAAGTGWALDMPSRRSLIHDLMGSSGLTNAVALDSVGTSISMMIGPALAGGLIAVWGVTGGYVAVSLFYITSFALLWKLRVPQAKRGRGRGRGQAPTLSEGLRYVAGHPTLRATVLITLVMNMLMYPYMNLLPVIARDVLEVGPGLMGLLQSTAGLGSAVGAVVIASWVSLRYHGRLYLGGAMASSFALLLFSLSRRYLLSLLALLGLGIGVSGFSTMQSSIVMLLAAEEMRGRALGVITLAIGTSPFGALVLGVVANAVSPQFAIGINAAAAIACLILIGLAVQSIRRPIVAQQRS